MFAAVTSVALVGVEPQPVRVEVHVGGGAPAFFLVGLPDTAVREAKERVRAALSSSGYRFPARRVTVNLAPADLPKAGSAYDLPIALGLLAAAGLEPPGITGVVALGELALDGGLRPARGGLAAGLVARKAARPCLLAPQSAAEAAWVDGTEIRAAHSLAEAVAVALGETPGSAVPPPSPLDDRAPDLADVRGQLVARRALEIGAAGGHHLLLVGPPGSGKTMLAQRLPGLLPPLGEDGVLEVAQAWAAAGRPRPLSAVPPFRSPHHSATLAALVGGGSGVPSPGEVSLAHRGVLFLDELGEFPPHLLDALRQPLEEGVVHVARRGVSVAFPSAAQLVAAANPCPCGHADSRRRACGCSPSAVDRYRRRFSGPFLDRIDLRVSVSPLGAAELGGPPGEPTAEVRRRVLAARKLQQERGVANARLDQTQLEALPWESSALDLLRSAVTGSGLTGRGWERVRKVARTVADLAECHEVAEAHMAEALALRENW